MWCGARCGPGGREVTGDGGASSVQGRLLDCSFGSRARGGAHVEHLSHVCDARGVEGQRLVERPRVLPRVKKEGIHGAGQGAGGCTHSVQGRARLQMWGRAQGGAHEEHAVHAHDAGGVEAQRLVERRRALPRVKKEGMRCRKRCRVTGGGRRRATAVHARRGGGLDCRYGAGHGEERTSNM